MNENVRITNGPRRQSPPMHHVASGTYNRLPTPSSISHGRGMRTAEETWTLLPQDQWSDEFSPLYTNNRGAFKEGNPDLIPPVEPPIISREVCDELTGAGCRVRAVQNEALITFAPGVRADRIRELMHEFGLVVFGAWYSGEERPSKLAMSWFHVGVLPTSSFHNRVGDLVECLDCLSEVEDASYNDVLEICQHPATGLYQPYPPNDPVWGYEVSSSNTQNAYRKLGLYTKDAKPGDAQNAWSTDSPIDFFGPSPARIGVVVMDTGIDVDHEDFLTFKLFNEFPPDNVVGSIADAQSDCRTMIYTSATGDDQDCADALSAGVRQGISVVRGLQFGDVPQWEDYTTAEEGRAIPELKSLDFNKEWHGHGTAMAGYIAAAGNNGAGTVGFGTPLVKVMSARMRMVSDRSVDAASTILIVKCLTSKYGRRTTLVTEQQGGVTVTREVVRNTDLSVVYMGFAFDLPKRNAKIGGSRSMKMLLAAMRADRRAGNDRVWIAPAANRGKGNHGAEGVLSYPAAILMDRAGAGGVLLSPGGADANPAVLGVTGVDWSGSDPIVSPLSNYFTRKNTRGEYDIDTGVYGVSGPISAQVSTLDPRDYFYKLSGSRTAGYAPVTGDNPNAHPHALARGGYIEAGELGADSAGGSRRKLPVGNSVAAAIVAALAGILMSKWARQIVTVAGQPSVADRIVTLIKDSRLATARVVGASTSRRRVPGPTRFSDALRGSP